MAFLINYDRHYINIINNLKLFNYDIQLLTKNLFLLAQLYREESDGRINVALSSDSTCTNYLLNSTSGYETFQMTPSKFNLNRSASATSRLAISLPPGPAGTRWSLDMNDSLQMTHY